MVCLLWCAGILALLTMGAIYLERYILYVPVACGMTNELNNVRLLIRFKQQLDTTPRRLAAYITLRVALFVLNILSLFIVADIYILMGLFAIAWESLLVVYGVQCQRV